MPKAYIHLYNQCSTNLKKDLEAATSVAQVESKKDPIGLLKLIQGVCCSYDSDVSQLSVQYKYVPWARPTKVRR